MRFNKQNTSKLMICVCLLTVLSLLLCGCLSNSVSLLGANINEDGELVLSYSDGRTHNLGKIKGETGEKGVAGENGLNGKDGADGKDGANGVDGARGEAGQDGADGKDGTVTIQNDDNEIALAAAKGLRSAVSIYCTQTEANGNTSTNMSAGAGIIYQLKKATGEAVIITNYHVVYDAYNRDHDFISDQIQVYLYGSEALDEQCVIATYVGGTMSKDIAVLRISANDLLTDSFAVAATLGDSEAVHVGQTAIAIGNPSGGGTAVTSGVVSVDSETLSMNMVNGNPTKMRVMRIDTAVNHGNSGGGLFDAEGKVIGIVNAKIIEEDVENIGYAIPINLAKRLADNILSYEGAPQQLKLGIEIAVTDSKAILDTQTNLIHIEETIQVTNVTAYGLADTKGLRVGDVILSATHGSTTVTVTRMHHLTDLMLDIRAGDTLSIKVLRNGAEQTITFSNVNSYYFSTVDS